MTKLELIELIILIVVAFGLGIYYLIKAIKNGWIQKITATMNEAIKYAEKHIEGGTAKKEYVLQKVKEKCEGLGIPYTLIEKLVKRIIDKVIANYNVIKK